MTNFIGYIKERFKEKAFTAVFAVYILACVSSAVYWCVDFELRNLLLSLLYALIALVVPIAEYIIKFKCGSLFVGAVLFLALGGLTGSCFNLYTIIPFFDTLLHGLSGVLFACVGFALSVRFFGKADKVKTFFGHLVFALCFSLAIAVLWEIFEYVCTLLVGADMMEDTIVNKINSYLLAGSHTETVTIDGITKTVIYYGEGKTYTINGYLDLGLIDTLIDMIICTVGAVAFALVATVSRFKFPRVNEILIPQPFVDGEKLD